MESRSLLVGLTLSSFSVAAAPIPATSSRIAQRQTAVAAAPVAMREEKGDERPNGKKYDLIPRYL